MEIKERKKLGLWNIVGLGVGGTVGSGIFVTIGYAVAKTGRSVTLITIICMFYMLLAYWYNLALSGIFVVRGGDYGMKGMLLPPLLTGFGGWSNVIWAFGCTGYALALTDYLSNLWPALEAHSAISSAVILTVFFLLTLRGSRFVTIFQNVVTVSLIVALLLFVIMGIPHVDAADFFSADYDGGFFHGGFAGAVSAVAIMGWACQGVTLAPIGVIADTRDPKRTIPVGIIISCFFVAAIYVLMSYVAVGVLPYEAVAGRNLSATARVFMPMVLFDFFVIGGGCCALISSFLMVLIMIRYPLSQMADDGWLPAVFRRKNSDGHPYVCYLLVYLVALIPILTGMNVESAISMLMIPTMIINIYLNAACVRIPDRYPEQYAKSALKISPCLFKSFGVLGALCAAGVAVSLFLDLTLRDAVVAVCVVVFPLLFSFLALKKGSVSTGKLEENRAHIIEEALRE